ncbi:uncharacterized protein C8R40DRAFT_1060292 [Lentinula edodes]|uniref:uncharacterized protein n=1 Tax=Lentinula edodes TaxID=5353 RepID=UPI001E8D97CA|nr:uncharacterized protein C8R40DRAFT_1060292 [Lentinula edodes]KAH7869106.1 hypothetical protein C8R40DRAFT_1060292 [Lentinula edodes]
MNFVGEALNKEVQKINQTRLKEYQIKLRAHAERVTGSDNLTDLPAATSPEPVLEHIEEFRTSSRDSRGLQNDITGRLLCPVEFDWKDPIVRAAVRAFDPKYDFASSARARCFYKDEEFDPDDLDKGFLQSYLLVQVYRLMFTSPSSTKDQPEDVENLPASKKKKTTATNCRGNVTQIIHMNDVKPRSIAYAAIHVRTTFKFLYKFLMFTPIASFISHSTTLLTGLSLIWVTIILTFGISLSTSSRIQRMKRRSNRRSF